MKPQPCSFCGQPVEMIHVQGHYQCLVCKTNALPCCDGDNCDTNLMLQERFDAERTENKKDQ
ncbi:MAG: hypothetical protein FJX92_07700 [Bacteroidetes bacterium]|nr:hypothetical protein [Bacteroidota bacterium]